MSSNDGDNNSRKIGTFFTIKDLIVIITPLIALASAFFAYDTRISVLETKNKASEVRIEEVKNTARENSDRYYKIELELSTLQSKVENMASDQRDIEKTLNHLNTKIDEIKKRNEENSNQIQGLTQDLQQLEKR